jgi:hypothetical protein
MPKAAELADALEKLKRNDRVSLVRVSVWDAACPVCMSLQGAYPKDSVPKLPPEGCSCTPACTCYYEPVLTEIYP